MFSLMSLLVSEIFMLKEHVDECPALLQIFFLILLNAMNVGIALKYKIQQMYKHLI